MGDLSDLTRQWHGLTDGDFLAVSPPTRNRFTAAEAHYDAVEELEADGRDPGTSSYAVWHYQSHERAFSKGAVVGALYVHWGGDREVVRQHLSRLEGWEVSGGEDDERAFVLDKAGRVGSDGLPDPSDPVAVRRLLERLEEPAGRWKLLDTYAPLTPAEEAWLHDRVGEAATLAECGAFVVQLERRAALREDQIDRLHRSWDGDGSEEGGEELVAAMIRVGHPAADEALERCSPFHAAGSLELAPDSPDSLRRLLDHTRDRVAEAGEKAVGMRARLADTSVLEAVEWLAQELPADGREQQVAQIALSAMAWDLEEVSRHIDGAHVLLVVLCAQGLPAKVRARLVPRVPECVTKVSHAIEQGHVADADESRRLLEAAAVAVDELKATTEIPPVDLALYKRRLSDLLPQFERLSEQEADWFRRQLHDPELETDAVAFCLEVLVRNRTLTTAEIEVFVPTWKKHLARHVDLRWLKWRHPLVTLTIGAHQVNHPLAAELDAWWAKARTKWASELRETLAAER